MTKLKKYLSSETLMYVSRLWGNYYYSPIYDVFKLQNKAIRVVNDVPIMDITLLPTTRMSI